MGHVESPQKHCVVGAKAVVVHDGGGLIDAIVGTPNVVFNRLVPTDRIGVVLALVFEHGLKFGKVL